jgi:hypothetical protein
MRLRRVEWEGWRGRKGWDGEGVRGGKAREKGEPWGSPKAPLRITGFFWGSEAEQLTILIYRMGSLYIGWGSLYIWMRVLWIGVPLGPTPEEREGNG